MMIFGGPPPGMGPGGEEGPSPVLSDAAPMDHIAIQGIVVGIDRMGHVVVAIEVQTGPADEEGHMSTEYIEWSLPPTALCRLAAESPHDRAALEYIIQREKAVPLA